MSQWPSEYALPCLGCYFQASMSTTIRCIRSMRTVLPEQWQIHKWKEPEGPLQQISSIFIALKCKNCPPMKLVLPNQVKFCIMSWICPPFWFRPGENSFEGTVSGGMPTAGACVPAGPGRRTVSCCCHFESPSLENCVPDRLGWLACTHLSWDSPNASRFDSLAAAAQLRPRLSVSQFQHRNVPQLWERVDLTMLTSWIRVCMFAFYTCEASLHMTWRS